MREKLANTTRKDTSVWLFVILVIAGFLGNYFPLRLLHGFDFLFGSTAVLMVVRMFGIRRGAIAALIASSATLLSGGHPYAMVWLCGEALFVGWLLRKGTKRDIILYDVIYWPLVGAPLIWICFHQIMGASVLGTIAAMLMYWVVGITNALVASLLLTYVPRFAPLHVLELSRTLPIHHLIFNLLMAIVLVPSVVVMIMFSRNMELSCQRDIFTTIDSISSTALYETRLKLQKQRFLSGQYVTFDQHLSEQFSTLLTTARGTNDSHIALIDGRGKIIASTDRSLVLLSTLETCKDGTLSKVTDNGVYLCMPRSPFPRIAWHQVQGASYLRRAPVESDTSWSVVVTSPFASYQATMLKEHIKLLLVILALNIIVMTISRFLSRRLAAPLYELSRVTTDLPNRLLREKVSSWPESMITEIDQLIGNFKVMTVALSQRFQQITTINETLEQRVADRTRELTRANEELQTEIAEHQVTDEKLDQLMEELVNQLRFLQTLIDSIPNPIYYKDSQGAFQGCNRAFEERWGFSREEILGKTEQELFPSADAEIFLTADEELYAQGGVRVYDAQLRYSDGAVHSVIFYKATYDDVKGNLGGMVGTLIDISSRKKAETERDRLMVELQKKNKELEGIVYVASHDLRSPLVNVQGFSRKLAKSCAELDGIISSGPLRSAARKNMESIIRENIPKSLGFITSSIEKMDVLLNGLLRLSRLGRAAVCFETLDMKPLMSKIVTSMTHQLELANGRIEIRRLDPCSGDSVQVSQVFSNLLDNAIKYHSPKRPLVISIYSEEFDDNVRYCVEDNGIGIPREQQEKIWEIFHRLNPGETQGEGLGLTMARRIVDRLEGAIWVESEPDVGSRFYVVLPRPHVSVSTSEPERGAYERRVP